MLLTPGPALAPRTRRVGLAAAGAAALLLLSACGSASDASSTDTGDGSGAGGFAAYTQCLSENGVTLPSMGPGGPGGTGTPPSGMPTGRPSGAPSGMPGDGAGMGAPAGVDASAFAAAQEACASLRPTGGPGGPGGPGGGGAAVDATQLAAYTSCLKDHDVTATTLADLRALDQGDATVAAALATCAPLRPSPSVSPSPSG